MAYINGKEVLFSARVGTGETITIQGESAYEIAVRNGFEGSEEEWLESLQGEDGGAPTITVSRIPEGTEIFVANADGTSTTVTIPDGADGDDGVGISKVERTATNGKVDTYTITLTNGNTSTFTVTNGTDGTSVTVTDVTESTTDGGSNIVKFSDGKILTVKNGKSAYEYAQDGGYTGTEKEFAERFAYLMGQSLVGNIDENNVITVMGELSAGTYIVKYENADGTKTDIGTITISGDNESSYTNILDNTTIELNTRLSSTINTTKSQDGVFTTGWIPCDFSAYPDPFYLYIRGATWDTASPSYTYLWYASEAGGGTGEYTSYTEVIESLENGDLKLKVGYQETAGKYTNYNDMKYIRISARVSNSTITEADMANVIITINEPITD